MWENCSREMQAKQEAQESAEDEVPWGGSTCVQAEGKSEEREGQRDCFWHKALQAGGGEPKGRPEGRGGQGGQKEVGEGSVLGTQEAALLGGWGLGRSVEPGPRALTGGPSWGPG